jgi:hypothetical protein
MKSFETRLKTIEKVVDEQYGDVDGKQARARKALQIVVARLTGEILGPELDSDQIIVDTGIRRPGDEGE